MVATSLAWSAAGAVGAPSPSPDEGVWPLDPVPEVVSGFDPPGQPWDAGHRGVDLAGTVGQSVRAALAGTVQFAGRIAGRGVVVVAHGATRTTYEPVAALVARGSRIAGGEQLGTLELAGGHCLPRACLHWGLLQGEAYLDPLTLVGGGPVRLLPLWSDAPLPSQPPAPGLRPLPTEIPLRAAALATLPGARPWAVVLLAAVQARGCACR
ncbi:M23 family metallopeptidase [Nocardioides bigeumensis]|uniref:M23 family metallopeptidase n=2 Tax=Nocardioides bigeumensis TaxID=433657 RepID=A0ABP5JCR0_9ACTN